MVFWPSGHPDFWPSSLLAIRPSNHPAFWSSGLLAIRPSDHLVIRPSGHLVIWSSRLLAIWSSNRLVIRLSGYLVIQPSGLPAIQSSGHPNFWPSVLMSQKCPYWDIFGLPYCRQHQSQISYILPKNEKIHAHGIKFIFSLPLSHV